MSDLVGDTPLVRLASLSTPALEVFAKLEFYNPTGSVKDRAAAYVIDRLAASGAIGRDTMIVESSSGNFGIGLASACRRRGLAFTCVVDPFITPMNEYLLRAFGAIVVKVDGCDANGGFLLSRLDRVRALVEGGAHWINQYANPMCADGYHATVGAELCDGLPRLDYVFVAVSSGGTIAGVSRRVKECFPDCRVVAVDIEGSVIFGGPPRRRAIPGVGSSIVPDQLRRAQIDEVQVISSAAAVQACRTLLTAEGIFAGGSSGLVYAAMQAYFAERPHARGTAATLFPDRGERYFDSLYDAAWVEANVLPPTSTPQAAAV